LEYELELEFTNESYGIVQQNWYRMAKLPLNCIQVKEVWLMVPNWHAGLNWTLVFHLGLQIPLTTFKNSIRNPSIKCSIP